LDLVRLHEFLAEQNPAAAERAIDSIVEAPDRLKANPQIGKRLKQFDPDEVRCIFVARYEIRYQILDGVIHIIGIWPTREDR
jgi:plasmid stabilization system protein ParE